MVYSHYKGAPSKDDAPVAFVGKGITFDSGGISLKPPAVSDTVTSYGFNEALTIKLYRL